MTLRHILAGTLLGASALCMCAVTLEEAREMYRYGDFAGALPVFLDNVKKKPKDPALNQWTGVCLLMEGRPDEALPYLQFALTKGVTEAPRYLAEIAFRDYRFGDAGDYVEQYEKLLAKAKKPLPEEMQILRRQISLAEEMLDRVERIEVIDSMHVDRDTFFKYYKLPKSSGTVGSVKMLPRGTAAALPTTVYSPESGEYLVWSAPDADDNFRLMQMARLVDGTWEDPHLLGERLEGNDSASDSNYPFMLSDGVTLYFANNGAGSLGGYDLFISRRDEDGFLEPQNLGMPYNSPYDDYMMAVDEEHGVGWWATDRNQLDDKITVYRFVTRDMRENISASDPNLLKLARLTDVSLTHPKGADYSALLAAIDNMDEAVADEGDGFAFAMPGGKVFTSIDDFRSPRARQLMDKYLLKCEDFDARLRRLAEMRRRWHEGDRSLGPSIEAVEREVERNRVELRKAANEVIKAETSR